MGEMRCPNEEECAVLSKMQELACERFEPDAHPEHEKLLKRVWTTFHDNVHGIEKPFERHHTDWQKIGFQGSDPVSDIRGGGVLAVSQILYFFENHTDIAVGIAEANEPEATGEEFDYEGPYYPFATASIHVTAILLELFGVRNAAGVKTDFTTRNEVRRVHADVSVCVRVRLSASVYVCVRTHTCVYCTPHVHRLPSLGSEPCGECGRRLAVPSRASSRIATLADALLPCSLPTPRLPLAASRFMLHTSLSPLPSFLTPLSPPLFPRQAYFHLVASEKSFHDLYCFAIELLDRTFDEEGGTYLTFPEVEKKMKVETLNPLPLPLPQP